MKKNGPFKSSLVPFTELIYNARFIEGKTGSEIRSLLREQGIDVAISTILDFINVRQKRSNPRRKIATENFMTYLPSQKKETQFKKEDEKKSSSRIPEETRKRLEKLSKLPKEDFFNTLQPSTRK